MRVQARSLPRVWLAACFLAGAVAVPAADDLAAKAQRGREAMAAGRFDEAASLYAEFDPTETWIGGGLYHPETAVRNAVRAGSG